VDTQTRTIQVRIELPNPGLALKPEMFVNVELRSPAAPRLTVPAEAVLDTGLKKTVFVDLGNGHFEPREVETGERIGDRIAVLKGLAAGERLVTSGNFLIESESQLKAAAGATHD
jgi:multidrug efflux pump subunit AcrA (membrane-fusion protein)